MADWAQAGGRGGRGGRGREGGGPRGGGRAGGISHFLSEMHAHTLAANSAVFAVSLHCVACSSLHISQKRLIEMLCFTEPRTAEFCFPVLRL